MIYWQIFWVFFITNILGYGGGPAAIPLVQYEVVQRYKWLTMAEFSEIYATGNSLPGPIATKMAGYIGYLQGGYLGLVIAVIATVIPSLIIMLLLLKLLYKYRESIQVQRLTKYIRPGIAFLLGTIAFEMWGSAWHAIGTLQTLLLIIFSYILLKILKLHPAFVMLFALIYGALFLR